MPRSAKLQASIDRHRRSFRPRPKAETPRAPTSWWTTASRANFTDTARKDQQERMAQHSGMVGDRGGVL